MNIKKIASLALALVMALALTACGSKAPSGDAVVAEGTGHTSHGYEVEVLYQEYGDSSVKVSIAYHSEDYGAIGVQYSGSVTKGKDADGDPLVTLHINEDYEGGAEGMDLTYNYGDPTTSTYDESSGAYTLVFPLSVFGYADKEVTLEVNKTNSPTDATAWYAGYGVESLEVSTGE